MKEMADGMFFMYLLYLTHGTYISDLSAVSTCIREKEAAGF